jgi:peroxiredoxin Q/BCP
MPIPNTGDTAPDFQLKDQNGNDVKLSQYRGKHVVLYFYPKDDTSGCTREACDFRDEHSALELAGAVVLGVSPDDTRSHLRFATKYSLPFPLLADTERKVCDAYGVWGEKSLYGRKFLGVTRATFVIDTQGKVARVWPKVKVEGHVEEILQTLKEEAPAPSVTKKAPTKKTVAKKAAPVKEAVEKKAVTKKAAAKKPVARAR